MSLKVKNNTGHPSTFAVFFAIQRLNFVVHPASPFFDENQNRPVRARNEVQKRQCQ